MSPAIGCFLPLGIWHSPAQATQQLSRFLSCFYPRFIHIIPPMFIHSPSPRQCPRPLLFPALCTCTYTLPIRSPRFPCLKKLNSTLLVIPYNTPVTLEAEWAGMPSEWKFLVHSWIFEAHSKNSDCILSAFQTFGSILVTGPNVLVMFKTFEVHSKWRYIERHLKCILTALWLHSKYSYDILRAFDAFWLHSDCILEKNESH